MVSLVVVRELCIAVAGSPELRRYGRPPRRALRRCRRPDVRPVEFACSCSSSQCFPRGKWGTPAPKPLCAGDSATGRRHSSPVGRRRLHPHATCAAGSRSDGSDPSASGQTATAGQPPP
jgi:hypothetical protein